jgi:hypothetical protein
MEITLRGLIEKELDSMLKTETLNNMIKMFKQVFPIKSTEDATFGFFVGAILTRAITIVELVYRRQPTDEEYLEMFNVIERRTFEIKGEIKKALGR